MKSNVIYIRTSTKEQNPENQLVDCLSINKFGEYEVLEDKQSAWCDKKKRVSFENLLSNIKKGHIKNLIVWDLDRLYRNRVRLVELFKLCKVYNCTIWSYRQQFLNEMQSLQLPETFGFIKDMMVNNFIDFLGWIAEEESLKKSKRVKASVRKDKNGITISHKGHKWGCRAINIPREEVLKFKEQGLTLKQIAEKFTYRTKSGKKKNPSYCSIRNIINGSYQLVGKNFKNYIVIS